MFVDIEKTTTDSKGRSKQVPGLRGAMAGRVARVLVDGMTPFALTAVAAAAGVDRGYTTRILDGLADQALIERAPRGQVTDVDWPALVRARAPHLDLLARPAAKGFVSPAGAHRTLEGLADRHRRGYGR